MSKREPIYTVICQTCGRRYPEDIEMYDYINKNGMCKTCKEDKDDSAIPEV